jgi:hypothetical protein
LEPTLTRYGYSVPALSEFLNIRQAEVRAFLHGQLPPGRTDELKRHILKTGIPPLSSNGTDNRVKLYVIFHATTNAEVAGHFRLPRKASHITRTLKPQVSHGVFP